MATRTFKTLAGAYDYANKHDLDGEMSYTSEIFKAIMDSLEARKYTKAMLRVAERNIYFDEGDWGDGTYTTIVFVLKETKDGFSWDRIGIVETDEDGETFLPDDVKDNSKKPLPECKPAPAKGSTKPLTKAQKKAIRSECIKLAKGDRNEYDRLCKERGVDNHRN